MGYKLAVANQISIWLENQAGFDKYTAKHPNKPQYFLHFTTPDGPPLQMEELEEGLDWCMKKIRGIPTEEKYGFAFIQKVDGGKAGACYTYPEPNLQNDQDIATLEQNIIDMCFTWANQNNALMEVYYNQGTDKYLVVALALQ